MKGKKRERRKGRKEGMTETEIVGNRTESCICVHVCMYVVTYFLHSWLSITKPSHYRHGPLAFKLLNCA